MNLYRIEVTPFPMLLAEMIAGGRSGTLTIIREPVRKVTYWADGELVLVASKSLRESLGAYLFRRRLINDAQALQLTPEDWTDSVRLIHETEIPLHNKDTLLREWATGMVLPLFSLTDGSAIFEDEPPLPAPLRVPMRSMPAMVLEGVRSIRDGLVLRRSLGDLQRAVMPSRAPLYEVGSLPLTAAERAVVTAFQNEEPLEGFLRRVGGDSATTSRTVILMLALGSMVAKTEQSVSHGGPPEEASDPQRDLQLLAAIGGEDGRSLKVIGLARQLTSMSHYQVLKVPTRATRVEIMQRAAELKKRFDPATFPPIVWEYAEAVRRRIDEAGSLLQDPVRRAEYDSILRKTEGAHLHYTTQQRVARREFAEKNYRKSIELSARGDYYAAIVLLKQAVEFAPDHADAWVLLGTCQERNPLWHRDATESYEKALSLNPNHVEALLCLGDLYRNQGLSSRAESCWEDVLQIDPVNPHALKRLKRHPKKEKGKEDA